VADFNKVNDGIGEYRLSNGERRWRVVYKVGRSVRGKGGFRTKGEAQHWQRHTLVSIDKGEHMDTTKARATFGPYALRWLENAAHLRPSTAASYEYQYRVHIAPAFAGVAFKHMDSEAVRSWHARLLRTKRQGTDRLLAPATVAKAYRLLRQMCEDAAEDGYLRRNPCHIDKAATEKVSDRLYKEPPDAAEVRRLAEVVPERHRAMVMLAGFGGLRWGELAGLQRKHIDLVGRAVRVEQQLTDVNGTLAISEPKTAAGVRLVYLHAELVEALAEHLARHVKDRPNAYVFTSPQGDWLRASNFRRNVWVKATRAAGCPGLRFHDLRHAAATIAAETGATTKNLMHRMGHASPAAALRYQHARDDRQRDIADAMDRLFPPPPSEASNVIPLRKADG